MGSIKTHCGLIRGKRMRENQRLVCRVLSTTVSASTNQTIQMFSDVSYETGDQAQGYYLNERDPFVQNNSLFNIANST